MIPKFVSKYVLVSVMIPSSSSSLYALCKCTTSNKNKFFFFQQKLLSKNLLSLQNISLRMFPHKTYNYKLKNLVLKEKVERKSIGWTVCYHQYITMLFYYPNRWWETFECDDYWPIFEMKQKVVLCICRLSKFLDSMLHAC